MELTPEILLAFGILVTAFILFIIDRFPLDFVALIVIALVLFFGEQLNVTPQEAISGFSNSATITVMAVFILSAGIQRTGAINYVARRMIAWGGDHQRRQIMTIQVIAGPFSAFMNNTAAVAILIPAVMRMARESARAPSKLLIPLSYISQLAGVITVIGTSTNILASELSREAGIGAFSMFEFSIVGLMLFVVGSLYLLFVAPYLLPDRGQGSSVSESYAVNEYLSEILVPENSDLVGLTLAESGLQTDYGVQVLEILRRERRNPMIGGYTILRAGDILVVSATAEQLLQVRDDSRLQIEAEARLDDPDAISEEIQLLEVVIAPDSPLIGGTLISTNFRNRYDTTVIAMRKQGRIIRERLGDLRLDFGDTLLLQGAPNAIEQIQRERGFITTEESRFDAFRTRKIPIALGIVAGVVILAAIGNSILVTAMIGAVLMVLTGCLNVRELHAAIRWDVIFLLAGMIPLGIALQNTGGTDLIAELAVRSADYVPAIVVLYVFYLTTTLMTELISNNASVVVMVPIGIATATSLGLDPKAFVLAIMFAASTSFTTPMGYQTNTMIYGPGGYKFTDYVKVGGPLNLLLLAISPLLIWFVWGV